MKNYIKTIKYNYPLFITLFLTLLLVRNSFGQTPCPSFEDILNNQGNADEFGLFSLDPFSVSVDDGTFINSAYSETCGSNGPGAYYYMSFETDNDGSSISIDSGYGNIDQNQWHKVITNDGFVTNTFWIKPPTYEQAGNDSPDFLINISGNGHDKQFDDSIWPWANIISLNDPASLNPVDVTLTGPGDLDQGETVTLDPDVSGGGGRYSYKWYKKLQNSSWNSTVRGTESTYDFTMGIKSMHVKVVVVSAGLTDSATVLILKGLGKKTTPQIIPTKAELYPNYPNPFNPSTQIKYDINEAGFVSIKIYNSLGKEIATLVNERKTPGQYVINFNAKNLASGTYFIKLVANNFQKTSKMILLK